MHSHTHTPSARFCCTRLNQSKGSLQKEAALQKYTKMYTLTHVAESLLGQHGGDGAVPGTFVWGAARGNHPVLTVRQVHGARADRTGAQWAGAIIPPAAAQPLVLRKTDKKNASPTAGGATITVIIVGIF